MTSFDIFITTAPGLEPQLLAEMAEAGFPNPTQVPGGIETHGTWPDVWRANLTLRCASRVLARIGSFRAFHLAQLDKRSRKFPWGDVLRPDVPVRVETTCRKSKIYHAGAATQRIETALRDEWGVTISKDAPLRIMARIDDNLVTFSIDTSGEPLHKRGHKEAVGKAPMRETMAAAFLRHMGYDGTQPVLDPMCGSGTFVIEAAEIAMGLAPGRSRQFAFESLAGFDPGAWNDLRQSTPRATPVRFVGSDRDAGAIKMATANAARAGVADTCDFVHRPISDLTPPDGPAGILIVNPPYGARIGNKGLLYALHKSLGDVVSQRFGGWRVGIITSDPGLARTTGLALQAGPYVAHGGLKVRLYQTPPL